MSLILSRFFRQCLDIPRSVVEIMTCRDNSDVALFANSTARVAESLFFSARTQPKAVRILEQGRRLRVNLIEYYAQELR